MTELKDEVVGQIGVAVELCYFLFALLAEQFTLIKFDIK